MISWNSLKIGSRTDLFSCITLWTKHYNVEGLQKLSKSCNLKTMVLKGYSTLVRKVWGQNWNSRYKDILFPAWSSSRANQDSSMVPNLIQNTDTDRTSKYSKSLLLLLLSFFYHYFHQPQTIRKQGFHYRPHSNMYHCRLLNRGDFSSHTIVNQRYFKGSVVISWHNIKGPESMIEPTEEACLIYARCWRETDAPQGASANDNDDWPAGVESTGPGGGGGGNFK